MRIGLVLAAVCWLANVNGAFEVTGEFLYLRPSFCNTQYAVLSSSGIEVLPNGPVQEVAATFEPGFRVAAGYLDCASQYDVTVSYTRLYQAQSARTATVDGQTLFPVVGVGLPLALSDAVAEARTRFEADTVEVQVAHRSVHDPGFLCLRAWAGLRYAHLHRPFDLYYNGSQPTVPEVVSTIQLDYRVWGIGPMLGVNLRLDPFHCIGIGGAFSVGLLAGDHALSYSEVQETDGSQSPLIDLNFQHGVSLFPTVMARLGLDYCWCCRCWTALIEVGYEFTNYINALEWVSFGGAGQTAFSLLCDDARLDGFYVSLRVGF